MSHRAPREAAGLVGEARGARENVSGSLAAPQAGFGLAGSNICTSFRA